MPQRVQRSFTGGEIAPALHARADITKYTTGLKTCKNFFVRSQGGVYSRPGTKYIGELGDSSNKGRLIPFSFNTDQTYVLVFEHQVMRVIRNGGFVLSGGSIYTLVTPYDRDDLERLSFVQDADVLTIVHPDYDPRRLTRTDHDAWTLTTVDYAPTILPPTFPSDTTINITGATQANPCVVSAAFHPFNTGDTVLIDNVVGMTELNGNSYQITVDTGVTTAWRLNGIDSATYTAYTSGGTATRVNSIYAIGQGDGDYDKTYSYVVTAVDADGVESVASQVVSITTGSLSTTAGVRIDWNAVVGAEYYRVYKDPASNSGVYGWIGDSVNQRFEDYNIAPITSDAPPEDRQPFNGVNDKPSAITYYQQRQILANTKNEPQTVFTSQTNKDNSMRTSNPIRDDDAITFRLRAQQVNEIRHLVTTDYLIALTSGGGWRITEGQDEVLTPSTVGFKKQTSRGASWVRPEVIGDSVVYVQNKGTRILDLKYDFGSDKFAGGDLSIMAEHLFEDHEIKQMVYAEEPYSILWVLRDDGVLLGLTYQREHQVWAWHQHDTDGEFESITVISEDGRDAVYVIVKRTIDGSTKRYVERFEKRITSSSEDVWCVDCALQYDGVAATTISGLDHIEGKEVAIVSDGNEVKGLTVTNGAVVLPRAASKVTIGLAFTPQIELLDLDSTAIADSLRTRQITINECHLEVQDSRGGHIGAVKEDGTADMYEIKPRFDSDGYTGIKLKNFKYELVTGMGWSKKGSVRVEQRSPFPLAILAVTPELDVGR